MIGDLFYHRVAPSEIESMSWTRLKYYHGWVKIIEKAKADSLKT